MESTEEIDQSTWDAAIVGAGPCGAVAAAILAARNWRVLLIEKSAWPRDKPCGGCLNAAAVGLLQSLGLGSTLHGARRVSHAAWHAGSRSLQISAPGGVAIARCDLDAAIVAAAEERGSQSRRGCCTFLSGATTTLLSGEASGPDSSGINRLLTVRHAGVTTTVRAGVVLACDGISGTLLAGEPWARWRIEPHGWIGLSTICASWPSEVEPGVIHMHVGPGGYVGLVRLPDERVHLAAALDPAVCHDAGGPARIVERIIHSCHRAIPHDLDQNQYCGTATLTRRREQLGGHRVLAVGDACGYVEPFTGEGMEWAIAGALAVVDLLPDAGSDWPVDLPDSWLQHHAAVIRRRQRWCRLMRPIMHHPVLAVASLAVGRAMPAVGRLLSSRICRAPARTPMAVLPAAASDEGEFR